MIELRDVVAAPGLAPLTATVRMGEVVRLEGAPAAARAVLEVIAGRRAPVAGAVAWRDPRGRGVLVRAGEALPPGVDGAAALALWCALAGGEGTVRGGGAAARGAGVAPAVWLIDGAVEAAAAAVIDRAEETVRGGSGAMVWSAAAARGRADRAIVVEEAGATARGGGPAPASASRELRPLDRARAAWALARFAAAASSARGAIGVAVVSALWLAVVAATLAVHEGFWYVEGGRHGLGLTAWLGGLGVAAAAAAAAAGRAAAARAWPAMLRETRVQPAIRALALTVGDGAGAVPAAVVAAWPSWWMTAATSGAGLGRTLSVALAIVLAAVVAGALTRAARSLAPLGALVGVGVAAYLMW